MQGHRENHVRSKIKVSLSILVLWGATVFGYGCNNQKSQAPKKSVDQSASTADDQLRREVQKPDAAKSTDTSEDKDKSTNNKAKKDDSSSSRNSSSRTNISSRDFDAILTRLGLTRGEAQAVQRFACGMSSDELARLASRFGFGGGSSRRDGFNLGNSDSDRFSRSDLDALRALAGSGREVSPETIRRAQDVLCNGSSGGSNSTNSTSNRSSRDDDDDDDDDDD